jgi:S1-C subfamily serine protease
MKARILILVLLLVGGFIAYTSFSRYRAISSRVEADGPLWSGPSTVQGAGLSADEQNNIEIYRKAKDATVNITSTIYRQNWFLEIIPQRESGSGFFIDKNGSILTNKHVVSGRAPEVQVTLASGSKYKATIIYQDTMNDLALIKINPGRDVPFLPLGDSEHLQVGQKVLAIGNPFGFNGTLTTGIVSSLKRDIRDENGNILEGMIQTDAAINPGNSGGPLLDSQGNVIGINTAIYGPGGNIGIGFAMPITRAKVMLEDYRTGRKYGPPPRLGVNVALVEGDLATELGLPEEGGLLIQQVEPGTPAAAAGLRGARRVAVIGGMYELGVGGDLIMAIDGKPCDTLDALSRGLARKRAGDKVELTLFRNGRKTNVTVTLGAAGVL